jgi:hypothetical protein
MPIFDIPSDRLPELTDSDQRELIARLCEAERERQGGHRNEVRWGGSQTAADGGLDVVVDPIGPFVPAGPLMRSDVGIQVKASDYAPAAITAEMRYGGILRPAISLLAKKRGAYVIASGGANCSEAMLQRRLDAMRSAAADDTNGADLDLVFLDRRAISRWVSAHPSVAIWLRQRLALPSLQGWQPYGRWSSTPTDVSDDLICAAGLAFNIERGEPIRVLPDALDEIRRLVRNGTGSIRIAGLSGIGKSRIVQALFEQVGNELALATAHAIYADLGHAPDPSPMSILESLIEIGNPAILIVDNCPQDTHQLLARKLAQTSGPVRIITVEYDVRTDRPEETDVIRIEAEGPDIVEALLRRRHTELSASDARRLAELAQGNARLAFALAQAAPHTGTLSTFDDSALFDRLFWQRGERNDELARAAEVLSLVYSFDIEGEEEPDELTFLGSLAELSRGAMHRHTATLFERGLAQARSRWRAVLPHALANRLAKQALKSILWRTIADEFSDNLRLRRSFARRLSYLHDSEEARRIVTHWMKTGGPIHGASPDMKVLEAVCHVVPDEALQSIKIMANQANSGNFQHHDSLIRMISRIAHSEALFPRACEIMMSLTIAFEGQRSTKAGDALTDLFGLYLSGTLAQTETRIQTARQFIYADDELQNANGIMILGSALRTGGWSRSTLLYNDARPDILGWEPRRPEVEAWFTDWFNLAAEVALQAPTEIRDSTRSILASEIGDMWVRVPILQPLIEEVARKLHAKAPWPEGRNAFMQMLQRIRRRDRQTSRGENKTLLQLINDMEPTDVESRVRAELVKGWDWDLDTDEDLSAADARRKHYLEVLGQELANDQDSLRSLGSALLEAEGASFYSLGTGLAQGTSNSVEIWGILRDLFLANPVRARQTGVLSGFIHQLDESNTEMAAEIRNECRTIPILRQYYAIFLPRGVFTVDELEHVLEISGDPETPAWQFSDISWREERGLTDPQRISLLSSILVKVGGPNQVIDALRMLNHVEGNSQRSWPLGLRQLGLAAIDTVISGESLSDLRDDHAARALVACLRGDNGSAAIQMMDAILNRSASRYGSTYDVERLLSTLAERAPKVFLDRVFSDNPDIPKLRFRDGRRLGPLSHVPIAQLIDWCAETPDRWARVAAQISPFASAVGGDGEADPISDFAVAFLNAAPCPGEVVEAYLQHLPPTSWSGSRADITERRLEAVEALIGHQTPEIGHTIARLAPNIRSGLDRMRQNELREDCERDQRFE